MPRTKRQGTPARAIGQKKRKTTTRNNNKTDVTGRGKGKTSQPSQPVPPTTRPDTDSDSDQSDSGNPQTRIEFPTFSANGTKCTEQNFNVDIEEYTPRMEPSFSDHVGANVPLRIREKIWAGKFVDFSTLLKPEREANELEYSGDIKIRNYKMVVEPSKPRYFLDIEEWTSAFLVFMSVYLEKFRTRAQELIKYMRDIRLAAKRSTKFGWGSYDEQFRLRKEREPHSSWGDINNEFWLLYVNSNLKTNNYQNQFRRDNSNYTSNVTHNMSASQNSYQSYPQQSQSNKVNKGSAASTSKKPNVALYCKFYNQGDNCHFYLRCRYLHQCENCGGKHRGVYCRSSQQGR